MKVKYPAWNGAKDLFCDEKGGNMKITLTIAESAVIGKPADVYKDTLRLILEPAS